MSDIKKFVKLYRSVGIELKVNVDELGYRYIVIGEGSHCDDEMSTSKLFGGYTGFYSKLIFTQDGRFISQEFYE